MWKYQISWIMTYFGKTEKLERGFSSITLTIGLCKETQTIIKSVCFISKIHFFLVTYASTCTASGCMLLSCNDVTHMFQSESTLYSCLTVKELLARNRCHAWSSSDGNWTHNQLIRKTLFIHSAKLVKWLNYLA